MVSRQMKEVLAKTFILQVKHGMVRFEDLLSTLPFNAATLRSVLKEAVKRGLIKKGGDTYSLTERGRGRLKVVLAGGVFDVIHPGHIYTLKSSKALGDVLIVSVARDKTVLANKGHMPLNSESERLELVSSIRYVDLALLGSESNIFEVVESIRPDVIAIGYDQKHKEEDLLRESVKRGIKLEVVRLDSPKPSIKTSTILRSRDVLEDF
ncbi:MAG: adenylyltransferase/cytidyltransferase family protein [Nitrososphaerales archaeon]